jgi:anthranilate phosphoribosyltransferase
VSLRKAIAEAVQGHEVPAPLLEAAFDEIVGGEAPEAQIAGLLVALRTKGETVGEIVAAARALRAHADTAEVDPRAVDTCGTGGDGADTFNISTAAAFVVAGAGVPVAKHGNRSASSRCGSIDVLEGLGVRVELSTAESARLLGEVGVAPFFARRAHPAMRHVAPVRAALGIRTLMNCLGPLLNPVGARHQLVGVYDAALVEPLAEALGRLGAVRAMVVHGEDGLDEITTTGPTRAALFADGRVETRTLTPEEVGLPRARPEDLRGGDLDENVAIVRAILGGERGAPRDVVVANAGAALLVAGAAADWAAGVARAVESLDSGAAAERLAALVRASRALAADDGGGGAG